MKKAIILLSLLLCFLIRPAEAVSYPDIIDDIKKEYPTESFLIGIGNVAASGDAYMDRTRAEILARLDIAKQIRVSTTASLSATWFQLPQGVSSLSRPYLKTDVI